MDILSLSEPHTRISPAQQSSDLLSLLKAEGSIEALVIKLLGGKLLLSTRLGEILTRNSLNFKPGDHLHLRLAGNESHPVLKVSPLRQKPLSLDSRVNPQLNRVVIPNRPILASVSEISERNMQIKVDSVKISLPMLEGIKKGQLLSLVQDNNRQSVEIRVIDPKPMFKAILAKLIPKQLDRQSGLISFLRLLQQVSNQPAIPVSVSKLPPATAPNTSMPSSSSAKTLRFPDSAIPKTAPKTSTPARLINWHKVGVAVAKPAPQYHTSVGQLPEQPTVLKTKPTQALKRAVQAPPSTTPARQTSVEKTVDPGRRSAQPDSATIRKPVINLPHNTTPQATTRAVLTDSSGVGQITNQQQPQTRQLLLGSIPKILEFNAGTLKQWLEFSGLIRQPAAATRNINPYNILKQLVGRESFVGELLQPPQAPDKKASAEQASVKNPGQDAPLFKNALKLVEQALGQNLMQRATLGLQQENHQPLSLNLALPFIDDQGIKPLKINLQQRNQAQQNEESSWDIRVSFELSDLGNISCHLILQGQSLSASFYCQQDQTRDKVDHAIPELRQQLLIAGFHPGDIHSFIGNFAKPMQTETRCASESLLDIEV